MKKTELTRSLLAACSIVALSAVMYGCVHGGGDDQPAMDMEEPPTLEEQLEAANERIAELEGLLETATDNADDLQTELDAANATVADLQMQLGAANAIADGLQMDLDDANATAAGLQMDLDAANATAADLRMQLADAGDDAADLQMQLAAAMQNAADLQDQLNTANMNAADLQDQLNTANMNVADLQTQLADANADVADLQMQLNSANERVTELNTRVAELEAELDAVLNPVDPDPAATAAAATKATAMRAEAGETGTDDRGLGGNAAPTTTDGSVGEYTLAIEYGSTTITVEGATNDDDEMFVDEMAGLDRGRTMLTRTMDADADGNVVQEVAVVGTSIEAPEDVAFAMFQAMDGSTPQALNARDLDTTVDADMDGTADNDFTALTVIDNSDDVEELIMSTEFTSNVAAVLTFTNNDTTTPNMDEAAEVAGTYNGTPGTYRCHGTSPCTVTINAMGAIEDISAGWIFTPEPDATTAQDDYEYLSYGFWLKKTTDADDATTYNEVETFAMAHGYVETADGSGGQQIGSVTGTATYTGDSVGVYVMNVNAVSSTSGHFVADVVLNASFGGGGVLGNDQFTIGGTVDGFVLSGGEENDWSVELELADFSGGREGGGMPGMSLPGNAHVNTFSGVATGDELAAAGTWNGTFWGEAGSTVDHDNNADTPAINQTPAAVTGEFNANFLNGSVAGGFGAERD